MGKIQILYKFMDFNDNMDSKSHFDKLSDKGQKALINYLHEEAINLENKENREILALCYGKKCYWIKVEDFITFSRNNMEFLTTKEEVQEYELFLSGNAMTPTRFWSFALVKKEDTHVLNYYEKHTEWVKLNIEQELEKHGKIPLKFLKH